MDLTVIIEWFVTYLGEAVLILIPVLLILGVPLKMSNKVPDWLIIYILLVIGIIGGILIMGFSAAAAMQGIVATGVACLIYQLFKQASKKNENKEDKNG